MRALTRITVVNDNPEFLEVIGDILEDDRYDTTTIDGDEDGSYEAIVASRPDLLMIDLRMGSEKIHGWDIAQRVRQDPGFIDLPILLCSADPMALREIAEQLGEDHQVRTLSKPFTIDQLTGAIAALLGDRVPST